MTTSPTLRVSIRYTALAALLGSVLFLSSCCDDRGRDGRPGRAFLALEWELDMPDYLDAGTPDIPATFEWGRSYRAYPGWYLLYYEGHYWNGSGNVSYAWEMEYEIWEAAGDRGGYNYDGEDGPDTYFTLWLSPTGPYFDETLAKRTPGTKYQLSETSEGQIEVLAEGEGYSMRAVFRKLEPGSRSKE
ncbi:MAG: hypothetical protein IH599_08110 [Bacteroidales bacterium]|nr:hypothetical protein [Bacteroidales bacterium]